MKKLFFISINFLIKWTYKALTWLHKRYADYLAETNNHYYYLYLVGWKYKILSAKEIDGHKITDIKYAKKKMRIKHAKIHATKDFNKYLIYTARPKQTTNN